MPTEENLHVCGECGCLLPKVQTALAVRDERIETLLEDVENAERELRAKRAQIKALKRQQDQRAKSDPKYEDAMEVLEHWRMMCAPNSRELGGKRLENVLARLNNGYGVAELKLAANGYAARPYVVNGKRVSDGHKENWYADAELVFRDAQKVDAGIRMATMGASERTPSNTSMSIKEARVWVLDRLDDLYPGMTLRDEQMGWWVSPCPVCQMAHLSLRVLDRNEKPWLFCTECEADGPKVAEALRAA